MGDPWSAINYLGHVGEVSDDRVANALTSCDQVSEVHHSLESEARTANVCLLAVTWEEVGFYGYKRTVWSRCGHKQLDNIFCVWSPECITQVTAAGPTLVCCVSGACLVSRLCWKS